MSKPSLPNETTSDATNHAMLTAVYAQLEAHGKEAFFASLELVDMDWEKTPITVLAKLIEYEAVHPMESLDDLKVRLKSDRKIYAFFHPGAPHEPLIFVQVAFTRGMADNIQHLLDINAQTLAIPDADTLTFYSISNAQEELRGINVGNFLIKRVVEEIAAYYPHIQTFATLSPIIGFRDWLEAEQASPSSIITAPDMDIITRALDTNWHMDAHTPQSVKYLLMRLCAHYLLHEKCEDKPCDPVAHFHLSNGAMLARLNWLADLSDKGLSQSLGMMANYHYQLSDLEKNREVFTKEGKVVASEQIEEYL